MTRAILTSFAMFLAATSATVAFGQVNDTESFTVTVPAVLTITAPANGVTITHDGTDANNAFAVQTWSITQNPVNGATAVFSTNQVFTHATAPAFKRDVRLNLAVNASDAAAGWTVGTAADTTNFGTSDEVATVQASSTAPGDATLNLTVTFLTVDFSTLAQGDYSLTVTGTLTAN